VAGYLTATHRLSLRRACSLVSLNRSSWGYEPRPDRNAELRKRLKELAARYPRYGSYQMYFILRNEMGAINHKRVDRVYRQEGLSLRRKAKRKRLRHLREAMPVPDRQDEVWSMDFIHDQLTTGRRLKCLTIIDHCSREAPALHADHSIRGIHVVQILERLRAQGRKPKVLVTDNGSEFTSRAMAAWAAPHGVRLFFIEPGKPVQNAFIESFNGKFRNLCLNQNWFSTLPQAQLIIEAWRKEYNNDRPHSSLDGLTPQAFLLRMTESEVQKRNQDLRLRLVQ
jgi:putative transposase